MKKPLEIKVVIPDSGVLISLAHGGLLDVLLNFADNVSLAITDVVNFEATRKTELFDAKRIKEFISNNSNRVMIEHTGFHEQIRRAEIDPDFPLPPDVGELSIYGYINSLRSKLPLIPTLVIFEDNWFVDNQQGPRPSNTHLLSLAAFLRYLEKVVPNFSFDDAMDQIRNTRPLVNAIEIDDPAENEATSTKTIWKSAIKH